MNDEQISRGADLRFHQVVSPKVWTEDFQEMAHKAPTREGLYRQLRLRHGSQAWTEEYSIRLWNASRYMISILPELEKAGLAVTGEGKALMKNARVEWALYSHFATCDGSVCHVFDLVPLDKVIALAKGDS